MLKPSPVSLSSFRLPGELSGTTVVPCVPACRHVSFSDNKGLKLRTVSQLNVFFIRVSMIMLSLHSSRNPKTKDCHESGTRAQS